MLSRKQPIISLIALMLCIFPVNSFAKDIDKSEALLIAKQTCKQNHWRWNDSGVDITDNGDEWYIWTFPPHEGCNGVVCIDKKTGKVLRVHKNRV